MKILFIANGIVGENPGLSGGETRFIEIAKSLQNQGYEIHLLSSSGGNNLCRRMGLSFTWHRFSESKNTGRLTMLRNAFMSFFYIPSTLKNFEGVVYSTNEMVFDVLPGLRLKLQQRNKIRWATVVHWLPPFPPWKRKGSSLINSTLFFINERLSLILAYRFADVLLAVSSMTRQQLESWGAKKEKVQTVECGVPFESIRSIVEPIKEKQFDAVFMKRLQAVKGIFDVIDVWESVCRILPKSQLLIIGEGIDGERAQKIVEEKGLTNNIRFTGVIYDPKEKFSLIAKSKLFLLPTYEENWAIVIGEAMAAGVPVVSYGLHELVDVWGDRFYSVPVGDKNKFTDQVLTLLKNPELALHKAEEALDFVEQYDWRNVANREWKHVFPQTQKSKALSTK